MDYVDGVKFDEFEIMGFDGITEPSVSGAGKARVYFNRTTNKIRISINGGAYQDLVIIDTTPAGSDTQIQFNDGGAFAGKAGFTFNKTTDQLDAPGEIHIKADEWVILDA
jgi:hypothetical protein